MNEKQNDTNEKQIDQHWFLIKHDDCGAMFTLDMEEFVKSFNSDGKERSAFVPIDCLNCNKTIFNPNQTTAIIELFKNYTSVCSKEGFSIREFNPEDLEIDSLLPI